MAFIVINYNGHRRLIAKPASYWNLIERVEREFDIAPGCTLVAKINCPWNIYPELELDYTAYGIVADGHELRFSISEDYAPEASAPVVSEEADDGSACSVGTGATSEKRECSEKDKSAEPQGSACEVADFWHTSPTLHEERELLMDRKVDDRSGQDDAKYDQFGSPEQYSRSSNAWYTLTSGNNGNNGGWGPTTPAHVDNNGKKKNNASVLGTWGANHSESRDHGSWNNGNLGACHAKHHRSDGASRGWRNPTVTDVKHNGAGYWPGRSGCANSPHENDWTGDERANDAEHRRNNGWGNWPSCVVTPSPSPPATRRGFPDNVGW